MICNDHFFGFVFFNAVEKNVFTEHVMVELYMVGHIISLLIYNEQSNIRTLLVTVKSALNMTHSRDPETASHLERMSRYTRLIAKELAGKYNFNDQFIEHIYLFAPLHDLGKIKVHDRILLKPDKLTSDEFSVMQNHPETEEN
jgi:response regulator RpfG family c-di-GMP phosphodiesterase